MSFELKTCNLLRPLVTALRTPANMTSGRTFTAEEIVGHDGPIPGGREMDTLTHAEPGALGGGVAGERMRPTGESIAVDEPLRRELKREGGGD